MICIRLKVKVWVQEEKRKDNLSISTFIYLQRNFLGESLIREKTEEQHEYARRVLLTQ